MNKQSFCFECGARLPRDGQYCGECGTPVEGITSTGADREVGQTISQRAGPSESCSACGNQLRDDEMFCENCGEGRSVIKRLGRIYGSDVLAQGLVGDIQINGERSPLRALSKVGPLKSDKMADYEEGLLFMLKWGIAFYPRKEHKEAKKLLRHIAGHVAGHVIPFSGLVVPTAIGSADRRQMKEEVRKILSDVGSFLSLPGSYIIPYNEVSQIAFRQSSLDPDRFFLVLRIAGRGTIGHYTVSPEGYGKSGYLIACAFTNWPSALFSMCLRFWVGNAEQLKPIFEPFYARQAAVQRAIFQKYRG